MPLLLLSGLPCSGKTTRAEQLITNFQSRITSQSLPLTIVHIHDPAPSLDRTVFDASRREKDARAFFSSTIKRHLSPSTIVVADGMNYIKGFRYQLYCEAKAVRTTNIIVQTAVPPATARQYNDARREKGEEAYEADMFDNLVFRYEEPDGRNRWDSPLFVVPGEDAEPDYDAIWNALIGAPGEKKVVRPNQATVLKKGSESGYLEFLERICGEVVREVEEWSREHGGGDVQLKCVEATVEVPVDGVKGPQLQRLRRQFVAMNRVNEVEKRRVGALFVDYLNDAFRD